MKAHLKRSWVQYMSTRIEEHWLAWGGRSHDEIFKQSFDCRDISAVFFQYPVLEAASSVTSVHLRLKARILFHTISYYFILFHTVSYLFILFQACEAHGQGIQRLNINLLKPEKIAIAARGGIICLKNAAAVAGWVQQGFWQVKLWNYVKHSVNRAVKLCETMWNYMKWFFSAENVKWSFGQFGLCGSL